jgi:RNA polymerase sigma-70 factor (ECF subfamily)
VNSKAADNSPGSSEWLAERLTAVAEREERAAFADLFRYLAPRFRAFAQGMGVSPNQAEELAQEAMISVWRKAATFDPKLASPATWLFTIVRNKRIDMFRRDRRPHVPLDQAPDRTADERRGPEGAYRAGRARNAVQQALTTLSPEQRMVIHKAFVEDKTHSEVAAELELPLGTVKSRIRLALDRMRGALPEVRP